MKKSIVLSCFLVLILNGLKSQTVEVPYSDYDLNCSLKTDSNKVIIRNNLYKRFILLEKPSEDYDISFDLHITTISE